MARPQRVERPDVEEAAPPPRAEAGGPAREAFQILRAAFATLALLAGADKFFNVLVPWRDYLAPEVSDLIGVSPHAVMHAVGVVEILAGLTVAFWPSVGGWLVAAWLWAIAGNLLILPGHYDVVLRDLALSAGAVALARLALAVGRAEPRPPLTPSEPAPWRSTRA